MTEDEYAEKMRLPDVPDMKKQVGRPKGSKNKITALKLMAEEAARDRNQYRINYVIDRIISEAAHGDKASQKLVWQAVMSQGIPNEVKAAEKVSINIGTYHDEPVKVKDIEPIVTPAEVIEGELVKTPKKKRKAQ